MFHLKNNLKKKKKLINANEVIYYLGYTGRAETKSFGIVSAPKFSLQTFEEILPL